MEEVEVRVHRVRRRRSEPAVPDRPRPPNIRNWLIYAGLSGLTAVLMFEGHLSHKPDHGLPSLSEATSIRSVITPTDDSLQIVVSWDLTLSIPKGRPDSIRIKVVSAPTNDSMIVMQTATQFADTAYVRAPEPGQTLIGSSCVAAQHPNIPPVESCTPWRYVRPTTMVKATPASPPTIVIQPGGLQVDQDVDGRCAKWQQSHPGESVWVSVNRVAIRECTGPNGMPTVAQFCAFGLLPDGRKVKTANSMNSSYCDELFVEWARERYS